jgi:hypothetical protein
MLKVRSPARGFGSKWKEQYMDGGKGLTLRDGENVEFASQE